MACLLYDGMLSFYLFGTVGGDSDGGDSRGGGEGRGKNGVALCCWWVVTTFSSVLTLSLSHSPLVEFEVELRTGATSANASSRESITVVSPIRDPVGDTNISPKAFVWLFAMLDLKYGLLCELTVDEVRGWRMEVKLGKPIGFISDETEIRPCLSKLVTNKLTVSLGIGLSCSWPSWAGNVRFCDVVTNTASVSGSMPARYSFE